MLYFLQYKMRRQDLVTLEGLRSGGCEMTILSSDYRRMFESSFYWRKHFRQVSPEISEAAGARTILWQAQYLVRLEGDFILLRALEMRFHM